MRWQPETPECAECGFDWTIPAADAIGVVSEARTRIESLLDDAGRSWAAAAPGGWSSSEYVWHLVDVVRLGTERLWTIRLDPGVGLVCWDENELARVRQYSLLSAAVGLTALREATDGWISVVPTVTPSDLILHDEHRSMTAEDVIRRTAHEVHHHAFDIERLSRPS